MTCQLGFPNAGNPLDPGAMPRGTRPRSVHKGPQGNSKDFLREIMDLGDSMSQCVDMFQVKKLVSRALQPYVETRSTPRARAKNDASETRELRGSRWLGCKHCKARFSLTRKAFMGEMPCGLACSILKLSYQI